MTNSDRERSYKLKLAIEEMLEQHHELFEKLGSDYDENGVAYWEKWKEKNND